MAEPTSVPSPVDATYVEPSAEEVLVPGVKVGDLFHRNMTQPYVRFWTGRTGTADGPTGGAPR